MLCAVVLRTTDEGNTEFLAFSTPALGNNMICQPVSSLGLSNDERRAEAKNALLSEAGINASNGGIDLGQTKGIENGEKWQFVAFATQPLADKFIFTPAEEEAETRNYFWQGFEEYFEGNEHGQGWSPITVRCLRFVETKVASMSKTRSAALAPKADTGLAGTILQLAQERGSEKTICPSEVARHIAGNNEAEWRKLMKPIRTEAVRLANQGDVVIMRKGKPVSPDSFKGVYRIGLGNAG